MIALPPLPLAVKATLTVPFPAVARPIVGAAGTVEGVTEFDAAEAVLGPLMLLATTVQVTVVPFGTATTIGEAAPLTAGSLPQVAVKSMITLPPLPLAVKATLTVPFPAVARPIVGAAGTVEGVTKFEGAEGTLLPMPFVATTVQVTVVPFGTATLMGEAVPPPVKGPPVPLQVAV